MVLVGGGGSGGGMLVVVVVPAMESPASVVLPLLSRLTGRTGLYTGT